LKKLLEAHRLSIETSHLNFIASTEHIYKNPLDSYLYLCDLSQNLSVTIIPGLEWISREGVEIIFWFDSRSSLESALKILRPFSHSVWETSRLKQDFGAISCIPHPFTPGKTGAANRLGDKGFKRLLDQTDYVEKHNGISHQFNNLFLYSRLSHLMPSVHRKVELTAHLPEEYCRPDLGWSVGSDAHFPGELYMAGQHEAMIGPCWFEALKARLHFEKAEIFQNKPQVSHIRRNWSSIMSVINESLIKSKYKWF
jgi:hypothetical protein